MASTNKDVLLRGEIKDIPGTTGTENALFVFDSGWKWTSHIALSLAENLHTKLVHSDGTPHLPGTDCSTRAPAWGKGGTGPTAQGVGCTAEGVCSTESDSTDACVVPDIPSVQDQYWTSLAANVSSAHRQRWLAGITLSTSYALTSTNQY
eukprot:3851113-Rhodomonas_salina.3